jgi:hypothetical protein
MAASVLRSMNRWSFADFTDPFWRSPVGCLDEPFRVRFFDEALPPTEYTHLVATWPAQEFFTPKEGIGSKDSFNNDSPCFPKFIKANPLWRELYESVLSNFSAICQAVLGVTGSHRTPRFEWSSLPGDGGGLRPHTDTPKKIATAVLFMETEWCTGWGGQFEALRHRTSPDQDYTGVYPSWDEVEIVLSVPVVPRRILFMQRTNNSLHGVRPIRAPRPRRSITINLF